MTSIILKNYEDQKYKVIFDQKTGLFMRIENKGEPEPFWCKKGPELLDISITNWCDRGCQFCYRDSTRSGKHIDLGDYEIILLEASKSNVFQVALGGGNPNQHPHFVEILRMTREVYNIVPSYTTNGRGLTKSILEASKKYCGAVAVSAYAPFTDMKNALKLFKEYEIKSNIHFLLDVNSITIAIDWLRNEPEFLKGVNAIIFLNYKPVGNYKDESLLLKNSSLLDEFFKLADKKHPFKVGFDSCMVSGIVKKMNNFRSSSIEPCDASRFSAFISEDMKMYPCSFMMEFFGGEDLREKSFMDVWRNSELFNIIRKSLNSDKCGGCKEIANCMNGCPFLDRINLC